MHLPCHPARLRGRPAHLPGHPVLPILVILREDAGSRTNLCHFEHPSPSFRAPFPVISSKARNLLFPFFDRRRSPNRRLVIRLKITYNASPPSFTFSAVKTLVPRIISLSTSSAFRIFKAVSIASVPPVGYWNVAVRSPSLT